MTHRTPNLVVPGALHTIDSILNEGRSPLNETRSPLSYQERVQEFIPQKQEPITTLGIDHYFVSLLRADWHQKGISWTLTDFKLRLAQPTQHITASYPFSFEYMEVSCLT
jgi:hypothetical protein